MKTIYVQDLEPGSHIRGETFAIKDKKLITDKNGTHFYDLTLFDKTGSVSGKIWSAAFGDVDRKAIQVGSVVRISAAVNDFKGTIQLSVTHLEGVDETALEEYLTSSRMNADEMMQELWDHINSIQHSQLKDFATRVFSDPEVARKFKYWPAANSYHHEFRSGLLQHTLECLSLLTPLKRFYPDANYDVVIVGLLLHDIGKLDELDASGVVSRYTVKGSALSHVYIATEYVDRFWPQEAPENLKVHIKHIILAHNGDKEKGAPTEPITLEAGMVSEIDHLSSMLNQFDKGMDDEVDEYGMTGYNRWLQRWMWPTRNSESARLD